MQAVLASRLDIVNEISLAPPELNMYTSVLHRPCPTHKYTERERIKINVDSNR